MTSAKTFLISAFCLAAASIIGCSSTESTPNETSGSESEVVSDATLKLTASGDQLVGRAKAGGGLRVEYALERLPQCRGNVGGGGPAWTITGFYSVNGGEASTFEVSTLTPDGKDRVAKPARIALREGGDLALWFQVSSGFGCSEYDSQNGQNFHVNVEGQLPAPSASIVFKQDGAVEKEGTLRAGDRVSVRYEQDRLPQCRRVQAGNPLWNISGHASINGGAAKAFETSKVAGSDREAIDTVLDLPSAGELALWFDVTSVGGCHEVDSQGGQNYRFAIE